MVLAFLVLLFAASPASATFSIVAFDPKTGDLGVAVASRVFGVGNHVPWAEAGVGVVATQAAMNGGYGPRGLELLRQGLSARQPWRAHSRTRPVNWPNVSMPRSRSATMQGAIGEAASRRRFSLSERAAAPASITIALCYINVDDSTDPLLELGRLLPLQLAWSLSGKRSPLVQPGQIDQAMQLADNLVRWAPLNGAHRIHQGFIASLVGNEEKALSAFRCAMELDPNARKTTMESALAAPATVAYRNVLQDAAFAAQMPQ
ncbi:MAG: DUF1028 domain-containing protein [Vicinamibacterales bacterium]